MVTGITGFNPGPILLRAIQSTNVSNANALPSTPTQGLDLNQLIRELTRALAASGVNSGVSNAGNAAGTRTAPAQGGNNGRLRIAQIDNFTTDNTGFNHGNEIAKALRSGGGDKSLAGNIDLVQFNTAGGNPAAATANALESLVQRVQSGEKIDAVNISLQDMRSSGDTQRTQAAISKLKAMGVPVAVAAGNNGRGTVNQLGNNDAFMVESTTNGRVNGTSGQGNIQSEGRTTSFATANLTPMLAKMKAQGMSPDQMKTGGATPTATASGATGNAGAVVPGVVGRQNTTMMQLLQETIQRYLSKEQE